MCISGLLTSRINAEILGEDSERSYLTTCNLRLFTCKVKVLDYKFWNFPSSSGRQCSLEHITASAWTKCQTWKCYLHFPTRHTTIIFLLYCPQAPSQNISTWDFSSLLLLVRVHQLSVSSISNMMHNMCCCDVVS